MPLNKETKPNHQYGNFNVCECLGEYILVGVQHGVCFVFTCMCKLSQDIYFSPFKDSSAI